MKHLRVKPYIDDMPRWPEQGQAILAQFDDDTVVTYQAHPPAVGRYLERHERLGGPAFNPERMSWFQTSFFGLMHACDWGRASGLRVVLAIWLRRSAFDALLTQAVQSRFVEGVYADRAAWQAALEASDVRGQWDPDYPPHGPKLRRRAFQLGLRGEALRACLEERIAYVEDISEMVEEQAEYRRQPDLLFTPAQRIYPVRDAALARRLGLDRWSGG